jgi:hypothetical protein
MNIGWIKLHRQFKNWEWYNKSEMVHLFIHCLIKANYENKSWQGEKIEIGSFITSLQKLYAETGISVQTIRTCLKKLEKTNEIIVKSTNKLTKITICKYESYQLENSEANKQLTIKQQATNKQLTTTKESKESKEEKRINIDNKESITPKNEFSEEIINFYDHILQFFDSEFAPQSESQKNKWLDCIDKLIRIDNLNFDEILQIVKNARNDQFWSGNVRTLLKLRMKNKEGIIYWQVLKKITTKKQNNGAFTQPLTRTEIQERGIEELTNRIKQKIRIEIEQSRNNDEGLQQDEQFSTDSFDYEL